MTISSTGTRWGAGGSSCGIRPSSPSDTRLPTPTRCCLHGVNVFVASHHGRENGYCEEVLNLCPAIEVFIISDKHTGAYWLLLDLRAAITSWNPLRHTEFATIRLRLLKIAGRFIEHRISRIWLASGDRQLVRSDAVVPLTRRAQFPGSCLLLTRYGKRTLEIRFRFPPIRLRRFKYDFSGNAIDLSLEPPFPGCLNSGHRFASATSGVIERLAPALARQPPPSKGRSSRALWQS